MKKSHKKGKISEKMSQSDKLVKKHHRLVKKSVKKLLKKIKKKKVIKLLK